MPFLLLAGLGNPGFRYEKTRHNIGFRFLDTNQQAFSFPPFTYERKFLGFLSRRDEGTRTLLLLKPDTYMNLSGRSIRAATEYLRIGPEEVVVIHDDIDIPFGTVKIKSGGGDAGHKGVASAIASLGTSSFWRIRLGIGRPPEGVCSKDYVLSPFTGAEEKIITNHWEPLWRDIFHVLVQEGKVTAANRFANRSCLPASPESDTSPNLVGENR